MFAGTRPRACGTWRLLRWYTTVSAWSGLVRDGVCCWRSVAVGAWWRCSMLRRHTHHCGHSLRMLGADRVGSKCLVSRCGLQRFGSCSLVSTLRWWTHATPYPSLCALCSSKWVTVVVLAAVTHIHAHAHAHTVYIALCVLLSVWVQQHWVVELSL